MDGATNRISTSSLVVRRRSAADICLTALTIWYLTGLLVALGFSVGLYLLRPGSPASADRRDWLDAFTWMDGRWYRQIAANGYEYAPKQNTNIAFFPVYPLVARAVSRVTGLRAEAGLLIVSNLSLLAALVVLAFYVHDRYPEAPPEVADYTVLTAAIFPTACFFRLAYSESTFFFLALLAMYAMLRRWPVWATGLIVGLATAARPVAVALLLPYTIQVIRRSTSWEKSASHSSRWRFALGLAQLGLYLLLACWGAIAFTTYQYFAFGEPFSTVRVQRNWGVPTIVPWREKLVPLATLKPVRSVYDARSRAFWMHDDQHRIPWFSLQFANPIFFVLAILIVTLGMSLSLWERQDVDNASSQWLSLEETALAALLLAIPYVTRAYEMQMGSMGRFVAVVFPMDLVVGRLLSRLPGALRAAILALCGFLLAAYTALYAARYLIF